MDLKKDMIKKNIGKKILGAILIFIPIIIILLIIFFRHTVVPSNEEIVNELRNTKYYTSEVEYLFKNSKAEFSEKTVQYYSYDNGGRIEFQDLYNRIKVYKGTDIKVEGNQNQEEFTLDKDIDELYPLSFITNILSNPIKGDIQELKAEWGDGNYLEVNIEYNSKNKHLNSAKFYIDKTNRIPVMLKILDDNEKERVIIKYNNYKNQKSLNEELF